MFTNIGKKIKVLAWAVCISGWGASALLALSSFFFGFALMMDLESFLPFFLGLFSSTLILGGGFLCSWVSSFALYGFGELIDQATKIAKNTSNEKSDDEYRAEAALLEKRATLERWKESGLITDAEYMMALAELNSK